MKNAKSNRLVQTAQNLANDVFLTEWSGPTAEMVLTFRPDCDGFSISYFKNELVEGFNIEVVDIGSHSNGQLYIHFNWG